MSLIRIPRQSDGFTRHSKGLVSVLKAPLVGISFSPHTLTVVDVRRHGWSRRYCDVFQVEIPEGAIEPSSGRINDCAVVRELLSSAPVLSNHRVRPIRCVLVVPSSVAFCHVWTESRAPRRYSQSQIKKEVEAILPGKADALIADIHQSWLESHAHTQIMLILAHTEVVQQYIELVGLYRSFPIHTTTAEIARCNLLSLFEGEGARWLHQPALILAVSVGYIEVTVWDHGVICCSERIIEQSSAQQGNGTHRNVLERLFARLSVLTSQHVAKARPWRRVVLCGTTHEASLIQQYCIQSLGVDATTVLRLDMMTTQEGPADEALRDVFGYGPQAYPHLESMLGGLLTVPSVQRWVRSAHVSQHTLPAR